MTIEIRELVLRARLVEEEMGQDTAKTKAQNYESLKHEILAECEDYIRDALLRQQER